MRLALAASLRLWYLAIATAIILCSAPAMAAEPLIYRRVMVPVDGLDGQIRGLLPLKREDFERRLAIASRASTPLVEAAVRLTEAGFQARLDGAQLTGSARLQVAHTGTEQAMLALSPCSLALESMAWPHKEPRSAVYGAAEDGRLLCLVDEGGELALTWHQAANTASEGHFKFQLQFPECPRRQFEVNAPADVEIQVDSGLIVASDLSPEDPSRRNWVFQLTGRPSLRLEAFPRVEKVKTLAASVVRDSTLYQVLPTTVDFETTLNLDVLQGSLHDINLTSKEPAELLAVQVDGQIAKFFAESDGSDPKKRYAIDLPVPLSGVNHTITVSGTAVRNESAAWRLPRVLPVGLSVEAGAAEVTAPSWLQLHPESSTDCVQTGANSVVAGRNMDRFAFQLISPNAAVELISNRSAQPITEESGTHVHFETNQVTGVFIADLASRASNLFAVDAQISKQWIVDGVETQPPDALADRMTTSGPGGVQRLRLQLARPISLTRPLRIIIRAHARRPAINEPLDGNYFRFARFPDARGGRQWLSVDVSDPHVRFEQRGKSPHSTVSVDELSVHDRSFFEEPASQIYQLTPEFRGTLIATKAQYHADVVVRADGVQHSLIQRTSIHCQPEGSSVPSVLVRLSPPPSDDVTWSLAGEKLAELPVTSESAPATGPLGDAYVRILLPKPQPTPFEIVGEWTVPLLSETPITLVTLPEAAHQQALLEVHAPANHFSLKTNELKPLPVAGGDPSAQPALRGRYQYDVGHHAMATLHAVSAGKSGPHAWIETMKLVSQFSTDGRGEHEMELIVHPAGDEMLLVQAPADAMHCRLVNENSGEQLLEATGSEYRFRVPLEPTEARTTLRIRYLSEAEPSGLWPIAALKAPLLTPDAVALDQSWQVSLPPQYAPMARGAQQATNNIPAQSSTDVTTSQDQSPRRSWAAMLAGPALVDRFVAKSECERSNEPGYLGWNVVKLKLSPSSGANLWVYRANVIQAWFWCFAFAGGALAWYLRKAWKGVVVISAVLWAVAVLLRQPWTSLAEGMAIGLTVGGVLLLLRNWPFDGFRRPVLQSGSVRLPVPASSVATLIALISLATIVSSRVAAQQSSDRRPKVVIAVDSNQQPTGDYVYLDEALYDALHRSADNGRDGAPQWLLESAHYEVPAAPEMQGEKPAIEEVRMTFDFYTFQGSALVRLPMRREQLFLLEGRARLDGQPPKLTWLPDGGELSLLVADAGKHRLELALGATVSRTEAGLQLDLIVPPAARATARLPLGAKLLTAAESVKTNGHGEVLCLADSRALKVLWPQANSDAKAAASFEAEQLSLWRVRWGAVVLESLIRVKPNGKPLREFLVECDPRLRILPPAGLGPIGRLSVQEGTPSFVKVELNDPLTSETSLRLSWLWPDASGLGQWELPEVRVRADRIVREWTAVWKEPGLSLQYSAPAGSPRASDFGAAFGESDVSGIAAVWDASRRQPQILECKPESAPPRAEQALELSLSPTVAEIQFTAHLTNVPRHRFEYRLVVPANVRVKQTAIIQRGRAAPTGWERSATGEVVLYLLESPELSQTLELIAEIPVSQQPSFQPPRIEVLNVDSSAPTLKVFRQADLQVSLGNVEGWTAMEEPLGRFDAGHGRLVAALRGESMAKAPPRCSLKPNRPQVSGQSLIDVQYADNEWTWEADFDLDVADGLLDELVISLPDELPAGIEIFPDMEHEFAMGGAQQRRLILRPAGAATGPLQVRLRGVLTGGTEGIAVPKIILEDFSAVRTFVLLDQNADENQFEWETTGLTAMDESARQALPPQWRARSGDWFQPSAPGYQAIAHARRITDGTSQIALMDVSGKILGQRMELAAEAIVLPTPGGELRFSLPPNCRLLQAIVEDITVQPIVCGLRSWKLPSISDVLPYRLTIIYDTFLTDGHEITWHGAAPHFAAAQVGQTLFTISTDSESVRFADQEPMRGSSNAGNGISTCGPDEAALVRIQALARAIEEITTSQDGTIPLATVSQMFARFEAKFNSVLQSLQKKIESDDSAESFLQRAAASVETVRKARLRLEHAGISLPASMGEASNSHEAFEHDEQTVRYLISENASNFSVRLVPTSATNNTSSSVLVILLVSCAAALCVMSTRWINQHWLFGAATFQLALIALIWWLVAPLGWLSWPLLLLAALGLMRAPSQPSLRERGSSLLKTI